MRVQLSEVQQEVHRYISQFEEGYFHPMTLVVRLAEELGELAREINHHYGEKPKKPDEPEGDLALEMGDILFVLACLANRLEIDLGEAFSATMHKFRTRDRDRWTRRDRKEEDSQGGRANG
ncbi:MazG nucleotide pyrophosphohydrolase [Alicyclobacillus acidocaldarius subsp. acidocaldarius Tc-4-1]|uniref:MazG nucleotide pyrophosphohydrolase n=1 Tax=Alicyclobacillus acidocaldarius (strain Tc-4-1) TaxID=1048834 RepID=F8IJX2_ALIAT|nr:MazG nucleotide pyrophosphohydrolase [Alicyclobacillus acidocaldarius subsp. acidocaldarius Tc-4-1]